MHVANKLHVCMEDNVRKVGLIINIPAVVLQCHTDQYHIMAVYADLSAWCL